jgi:glutathione synthase/RimK-type ligase-like ATP-grasp enzyme
MDILILSTLDDPHADAVCKELSRLGADFTTFNFGRLQDVEINVTVDRSANEFVLTSGQGETIELSKLKSIWFRRPGTVKYTGLPESWMNLMVESELSATVFGALRSLSCLWVNHPARGAECSFKLWQLEVARQVGLIVPESIITNSPARASDFFKRCGGEVIYKLIGEGTNFCLPKYEAQYGIATTPFTREDLEHLKQVSLAPHFFQRCIRKQYDIRVTAIGKKLFPVKIDSQDGKGTVDWRRDYSVNMEPTTLPDDVQASCLSLLKQLGLNYGAIDLCLDDNGDYVFFEINSGGQFLWMEERIEGLPLSLELAKLLIGDGEPVVPAGFCSAGSRD